MPFLSSSIAAYCNSARGAYLRPYFGHCSTTPTLIRQNAGSFDTAMAIDASRVSLIPTGRTRVLQEGSSGSRCTGKEHAATLSPAAWHRIIFARPQFQNTPPFQQGTNVVSPLQLPACLGRFNNDNHPPFFSHRKMIDTVNGDVSDCAWTRARGRASLFH